MTDLTGAEVAIIGVGGMGVRHVSAAKGIGATVVALCDIDSEKLEKAKAAAPRAKCFHSIEEFLRAGLQEVDLVCVVTNTPERVEILGKLAQAGCLRVLTEKPFTTKVADAHTIARHYEEAQIPLTINTYRNFCDNHLSYSRRV